MSAGENGKEKWEQRKNQKIHFVEAIRKTAIKDPLAISGRSYLRFCVADQPGVLAEITGVFGKFNISIAAMIQREESAFEQHCVQMIIMTHAAPEGDLRHAVEAIAQFPFVHGTPIRLCVQD